MVGNLEDKVGSAKATSDSQTFPSIDPTHILIDSKPSTTKLVMPHSGEIGGVNIDRFLKSGGMSDAYHGTDNDFGEVIVKVLQKRHLENDSVLKRFKEDAKLTAVLRHPNIVETLKYGDEQGLPYIVYKYIKNAHDLSKVQLSAEENAQVLLQIAKALRHAHSEDNKKQVIHRDVKPDNILVTRTPLHAYLIDFGIGKIVDEARSSITEAEGFLGTPEYMAPEQAKNPQDVTPKSDLYSWACTAFSIHSRVRPKESQQITGAFEMLEARRDFEKTHDLWPNEAIELGIKDLTDLIDATTDQENNKARIAARDELIPLSEDYEELIRRIMLAKNPDQRPYFSTIIPELEWMISHRVIRQSESSEEVKALRLSRQKELHQEIKNIRDELSGMTETPEQTTLLPKQYELAQKLVALADVMPKADEAREGMYREGQKYYSAIESKLDVAVRAGKTLPGISLLEVIEHKAWAASGILVAHDRKSHFENKAQELAYGKLFNDANTALDNGQLMDASQNYTKIDYDKLSRPSKEKYVNLTRRFEETIDAILSEGVASIDTDMENAEKQYNRAKLLGDGLPKWSDGKKNVSGFESLIQSYQFDLKYKKSEAENDFYNMLKHAQKMETCVNDENFPAVKKEAMQKIVDKYLEDLKPNKGQIGLLDELIKNKKALDDEFAREAPETAQTGFSEEVIQYLPKKKIDYYTDEIGRITKTFETLDKQKIGHIYDDFKLELEFMKQDLQAALWAQGISQGSYTDRSNYLNNLITLYHDRGDNKNERDYIHHRTKLDMKRLSEIMDEETKVRPAQ